MNSTTVTTSAIPDKYGLAIDYLTSYPDEIVDAWGDPEGHEAGCLFEYAMRVRPPLKMEWNVGCLTLIRRDSLREYDDDDIRYLTDDPYVAETPELTRRIQDDERIPIRPDYIKVEDLPVFAEWQRILDRELKHGN